MKIYLHSYVIFYIVSEKLEALLKFIIQQMEEEVKLSVQWVLQHAGKKYNRTEMLIKHV